MKQSNIERIIERHEISTKTYNNKLVDQIETIKDLCRDLFAGLENGLTSDEFFKLRERYREVIQNEI